MIDRIKSRGVFFMHWRRDLIRVSIAMAGAIVAATTEGPWAIAGAVAAMAVLAITVGQPILRWVTTRSPVRASFIVNGTRESSISLISHSQNRVLLEMIPRFSHQYDGVVLNCERCKIEFVPSSRLISSFDMSENGTLHIHGPYYIVKSEPEKFDLLITTSDARNAVLKITHRDNFILGSNSLMVDVFDLQ